MVDAAAAISSWPTPSAAASYGSEQAQKFLTQQIAEYEQEAAGRREQAGGLQAPESQAWCPGATGGDLLLAPERGHRRTCSKDQLALTVAEQKRDELRRQLSSEQPLSGAAGSSRPRRRATDTGSAIREAQGRLDELLLRYTDKHPDVIAARRATR